MASLILPLLGGALIGLSASLLLWLNGRIAGVSGIAGGVFGAVRGDRGWRLAF
ncbi:MAG: YeeE/YedE family protein, partial [Myxococcaceae bacterium]